MPISGFYSGQLETIIDNSDLATEETVTTINTNIEEVQAELALVKAELNLIESSLGEITATPVTNTLQDRIKRLLDTFGTGFSTSLFAVLNPIYSSLGQLIASPDVNSINGRLKLLVDSLQISNPSPANSVNARIELIRGHTGNTSLAVGAQQDTAVTSFSSQASLQARLRGIQSQIADIRTNTIQVNGGVPVQVGNFPKQSFLNNNVLSINPSGQSAVEIQSGSLGHTRLEIYNSGTEKLLIAYGAIDASASNWSYPIQPEKGWCVQGNNLRVSLISSTSVAGQARITRWAIT